MPRKLTTAEFIEKAVAAHGVGRYDYSQVEYRGDAIKVSIICPEHGCFEQCAGSHTAGRGCSNCGDKKNKPRVALVDYISRAMIVHENKYDYSKTVLGTTQEKIIVICPTHGEFEIGAGHHLYARQGCRLCANKLVSKKLSLTQADFIAKSILVHGLKYNYKHTEYQGHAKKLNIKCRIHGLFQQTAHDHLAGNGCPRCGREKFSRWQTYTQSEFLERANTVHGLLYNYSRVHYTHGRDKVEIICNIHGVFKQTPDQHINSKQGCPKCGREKTAIAQRLSWIERAADRQAVLYLLRLYTGDEQFFKIGITYLSIAARYKQMKAKNGYSYEIIASYTSKNSAAIYDWEQSILETFIHLRYKPNRLFGGSTECFSSCDEILAIFPVAG